MKIFKSATRCQLDSDSSLRDDDDGVNATGPISAEMTWMRRGSLAVDQDTVVAHKDEERVWDDLLLGQNVSDSEGGVQTRPFLPAKGERVRLEGEGVGINLGNKSIVISQERDWFAHALPPPKPVWRAFLDEEGLRDSEIEISQTRSGPDTAEYLTDAALSDSSVSAFSHSSTRDKGHLREDGQNALDASKMASSRGGVRLVVPTSESAGHNR